MTKFAFILLLIVFGSKKASQFPVPEKFNIGLSWRIPKGVNTQKEEKICYESTAFSVKEKADVK